MQVITRDLYLCDDCTIAAVNGDYDEVVYGSLTEAEADAHIAAINRGLDDLGPHLVPDDSENERAECGACGWHGDADELVDVYTDPEYSDWTEKGCPRCKDTEEIETRDNGRLEFSWMSCDCCGSDLGGSRTRFAILGESPEPAQAALI